MVGPDEAAGNPAAHAVRIAQIEIPRRVAAVLRASTMGYRRRLLCARHADWQNY
jgi:hypothetical protein